MARKLFYVICLTLVMASAAIEGHCLNATEIISNAKNAMASLSSVKTKGQTIIAGVDITEEETAIDYSRSIYYGVDKKDQKIITATYCENGVIYINEIFTGAWFQFAPDIGLAPDMFDRQTLFNLFPDDTAGTGFTITFAGTETVGGEPCYRIQSNVFNRELVKLYIQKSLGKFTSSQIAAALKKNPKILDDYLNAYIQNLQATLWISQDTFLVKKTQTTYNQIIGPAQSVSVRRDTEYYDFNKAIHIKIPQQAYTAKRVSAQDFGF